jgi:hypothetical protein
MCPEGNYAAVLSEAYPVSKESNDGELTEYLRFKFKVSIPWKKNEVFAGKGFEPSLEKNSKLRLTLLKWLGKDFVSSIEQDKDFDLDKLKGMKAELKIIHHHNNSYSAPYVQIKEIHPVGSLTLTTEENKAEVDQEKNSRTIDFML